MAPETQHARTQTPSPDAPTTQLNNTFHTLTTSNLTNMPEDAYLSAALHLVTTHVHNHDAADLKSIALTAMRHARHAACQKAGTAAFARQALRYGPSDEALDEMTEAQQAAERWDKIAADTRRALVEVRLAVRVRAMREGMARESTEASAAMLEMLKMLGAVLEGTG